MFKFLKSMRGMRNFLILWSTQAFSSLGSAMTGFALIIWSFQKQGSALDTALLSICSYAPYVLLSIFAGALSDRWNKKITMLVSDSVAAFSTLAVLILLQTGNLEVWHLYVVNTLSGLMNTVQQPAADVSTSLLTPKEQYQRVSGLRSFSGSLITILTPMFATAVLAFAGLYAVILFDLATFVVAFCSLLFGVRIPKVEAEGEKEPLLKAARVGLRYLRENRGILDLILFLAVINFTASIYNAALPALVLSRPFGGQAALGWINTATGVATLVGSLIVSVLPAPKSRVRVICNTLLISMSTENFFLAFGQSVPVWCVGAVLGWVVIPLMSANMDVLLRERIPVAIQGRVFSVRNTFQFFTIPLGYLAGGLLVDRVFEPFMAAQAAGSLLAQVFGTGKGAGTALLFLVLGVFGVAACLPFRRDKHLWALEKKKI